MLESIKTLLLTLWLAFQHPPGRLPAPQGVNSIRPYRLACSWLPVTIWLPRLRYYLMGVLVALAGHRPCYDCTAYFNTWQSWQVQSLFKLESPKRRRKGLIGIVNKSAGLRRTSFESLFVHCLSSGAVSSNSPLCWLRQCVQGVSSTALLSSHTKRSAMVWGFPRVS